MSEQVKVLAAVERPKGKPERVIGVVGEDADGVLVVAERGANGHFHMISPKVDYERARNYAEAVLTGDPRALTWPDGLMVLAVAVVGVGLALDRPKEDSATNAAPPVADAAEPAEATSPL